MESFTIEIAQSAIGVQPMFGSTREYFRRYLSEREPETFAVTTQEDLTQEQALLDIEADEEGLKRRIFTPPFLERASIQRKTAAFVLNRNALLLHGSTLAVDGKAYLFTAKCGVGKSTHTRLWRELLGERAAVINDDRAFLSFTKDGVLASGSPWSGKHGLDNNLTVPLAGICILERGSVNRISSLSLTEALPELLAQAYVPTEPQRQQVYDLTASLPVPLWRLSCTKDLDAARVAFAALSVTASADCRRTNFR